MIRFVHTWEEIKQNLLTLERRMSLNDDWEFLDAYEKLLRAKAARASADKPKSKKQPLVTFSTPPGPWESCIGIVENGSWRVSML